MIGFKSSKNSLHRAFKWERGHKFWTDFKKKFGFWVFSIRSFKFLGRRMVSFRYGSWYDSLKSILFKWLKDVKNDSFGTGGNFQSVSRSQFGSFSHKLHPFLAFVRVLRLLFTYILLISPAAKIAACRSGIGVPLIRLTHYCTSSLLRHGQTQKRLTTKNRVNWPISICKNLEKFAYTFFFTWQSE